MSLPQNYQHTLEFYQYFLNFHVGISSFTFSAHSPLIRGAALLHLKEDTEVYGKKYRKGPQVLASKLQHESKQHEDHLIGNQ